MNWPVQPDILRLNNVPEEEQRVFIAGVSGAPPQDPGKVVAGTQGNDGAGRGRAEGVLPNVVQTLKNPADSPVTAANKDLVLLHLAKYVQAEKKRLTKISYIAQHQWSFLELMFFFPYFRHLHNARNILFLNLTRREAPRCSDQRLGVGWGAFGSWRAIGDPAFPRTWRWQRPGGESRTRAIRTVSLEGAESLQKSRDQNKSMHDFVCHWITV